MSQPIRFSLMELLLLLALLALTALLAWHVARRRPAPPRPDGPVIPRARRASARPPTNPLLTDRLTGLGNRRAFDVALEQFTHVAEPDRQPFNIVLLDVDNLGTLNAELGHEHGDALLRAVADALRQAFRTDDQIYRLGGDEFVVLLQGQHLSANVVRARAESVNARLRADLSPSVRASIGFASFPADTTSPTDVVRLADQRMLRQKNAHRAMRGLAQPGQSVAADDRLTAEMMWQVMRATSALISADGVVDAAGWAAFLRAAIAAVPGAGAGSLYVREGRTFVIRAQQGFSDTLLGSAHTLKVMRDWYGNEPGWTQGRARVIRRDVIAQRSEPGCEFPDGTDGTAFFEQAGALGELQSNLAVPIRVDGHVVALMNLDNLQSEDAFEPRDLHLAEEFATQLAAILATAERRVRERARTRELEVLAQASSALRSARNASEIERMLVNEASALLDTAHAAFLRYDPDTGTLRPQPDGHVGAAGQGLMGERALARAALDAQQVLCSDEAPVGAPPHPTGASQEGTLLAAPMFRSDAQPVGVLLARRETRQSFSTLDARLLGALASAGVTSLEHFWSAQEEQRRLQELRMLAELSENVSVHDNVDTVARRSLAAARAFLQADLALFTHPARALDIMDGEAPEAYLRALHTHRQASGTAAAVRPGKRQDLATHDYPQSARAVPLFVEAGVRALVRLPVLERGQLVGLLLLVWFRPLPALPPAAMPLMTRVAELLGQSLDRAAHIADIEATREGALLALGLSLELRDFEAAGHTARVVTMARALGAALGLDGEALEALRQGAYLHDIGKLAVPDQILLKPGTLDADEWAAMQSHTVIGADLTRRIPTLPVLARQVVRHHHERWDGTGYPDRLAAEEIPLAARIFSVVDVFDALTSERPYKRAWAPPEALREIQAQAGRQFDPKVVTAFTALLEQGELVIGADAVPAG